jgi:DNA-binding IclR family transcriptional regulator
MSQSEADSGPPRTVEAVDKTCRIVQALHELEGAGVTELAEHLDISKGTIHTHLTTLRQNGFVVKDDVTYRPGLRFLEIGEDVRKRAQIFQIAKHEIGELAEQTDTRVQITVEEFGLAVVLSISRGEHAIAPSTHVGKREYLHCIACGKAILAHLPQNRVEAIIDRYGLPARTQNTITAPDELFEELSEVRDRGVAFNDEENVKGLRSVAAPIRTETGGILGSISASGPTSRMKEDRFRSEIPEAVANVANTIEVNIRVGKSDMERVGF